MGYKPFCYMITRVEHWLASKKEELMNHKMTFLQEMKGCTRSGKLRNVYTR